MSNASTKSVKDEITVIKKDDIWKLVQKYPCIGKYNPVAPSANDRANTPPLAMVAVYSKSFEISNFRLLPTPFTLKVATYYGKGLTQYHPFGLQKVVVFEMFCRSMGKVPSLELFRYHFRASRQGSWFTLDKRPRLNLVGTHSTSVKDWRDHYFFVDNKFLPEEMSGLLLWDEEKVLAEKNECPVLGEFDAELFQRLKEVSLPMRGYSNKL